MRRAEEILEIDAILGEAADRLASVLERSGADELHPPQVLREIARYELELAAADVAAWTFGMKIREAGDERRQGPYVRGAATLLASWEEIRSGFRRRRTDPAAEEVGATGFEPATFRPPAERIQASMCLGASVVSNVSSAVDDLDR